MTPREWILSLLIAAHIVAISAAAIPRPPSGPLRSAARSDGDAIASVVEGPLTSAAEALGAVQRWVYRATRAVRARTRPYVAAGLSQNWSMFSSVLTVQRYLRLDYYVERGDGSVRLFQELVLPSQPEGQARLTYRSADKAVRVVMGAYRSSLRDEESDDVENASAGESKLAPLVHYFATRLAEAHGIDRERLTRVEVWTGAVPIPAPGTEPAFPVDVRWNALARYRTPTAQLAMQPSSTIGSTNVQAGITWQLIHIELHP